MKVVNAYTIPPVEIQRGDVMMFVVKAMVTGDGLYRLYRCEYDPEQGETVPQGARIYNNEREICEALFPSLAAVAEPDS